MGANHGENTITVQRQDWLSFFFLFVLFSFSMPFVCRSFCCSRWPLPLFLFFFFFFFYIILTNEKLCCVHCRLYGSYTHTHKPKRIVCIDAFVDPVNLFAIILLLCSAYFVALPFRTYAQNYCNRFQLEM